MQVARTIQNVFCTVRVLYFLTKPNYYLVANRNVAYIHIHAYLHIHTYIHTCIACIPTHTRMSISYQLINRAGAGITVTQTVRIAQLMARATDLHCPHSDKKECAKKELLEVSNS